MKHMPTKPTFDLWSGSGTFLSCAAFNLWFTSNIEPLFKNAVEVVGYIGPIDGQNSSPIVTKKGIFISADILSGPSAEDLLREIVKGLEHGFNVPEGSQYDIVHKVKFFLDQKK